VDPPRQWHSCQRPDHVLGAPHSHDDLLTVVTIQEDPFYLSEPHVVSRVFKFDPARNQGGRSICNTANEIPRLEDSGIVPHYLPGQNPEPTS
jgi:hypothetical protein